MDLGAFFLSWTPVVLLTVLAVVFRRPALEMSIYGTLFTLGLVVWGFGTPWSVALMAGLDGVLTTLPLLLVIFAGILLSNLLFATGTLRRIVDWFMGGLRTAYARSLLITLGVGNFLEGAGVIAEPVVAPMLAAAGVGPAGSAALSIVGYSGLMTLEMAGIILTVLSLVTGLPLGELGVASAWLSIPATLAMAACVPIFLPRPWPGLKGWLGVMTCGMVLGLAALAAVSWLAVSVSGMVAGLALILVMILAGGGGLSFRGGIWRDLAPFALLLAALLLLNLVPPLKELTFHRLSLQVKVIPVHTITFRPLFSAYLYLFAAFALAAWLFGVRGEQLREVLASGLSKGWRASLAMALFGGMGQIIAYSGYGPGFAELNHPGNLPWVMAHGLAAYAGGAYPVFVPLLGWVGTFLTGYGVASLMLFAQLQVDAAHLMGVSAVWLASGLAVGASLGSISSPFKIAIATPMCGALGQEGAILRLTIPLGAAASLLIGVVLWAAL